MWCVVCCRFRSAQKKHTTTLQPGSVEPWGLCLGVIWTISGVARAVIYPSEMLKKMNQPGLRCTKRKERYAECKCKSLTRVTLEGPK